MKQADLERIVRRGGLILAEALDQYWPTNGDNEVGERNITLAFARSFGDAGFRLYAEGHTGEATTTRLDLLALHLEDSVQVAIEAKRLYNSQQARSMLDDVARILAFKLPSKCMLRGEAPQKRFGVVAATTWNDEYAKWFSREDADDPQGSIWPEFTGHAALQAASWGSVVLRGYDNRRQSTGFHHLVYCLFPVDS